MEIKILKDSKAFIDYSQFIDLHENLEDFNPIRKKRVLIVFDNMIADMESRKKLNIWLVFISQSYFKVP